MVDEALREVQGKPFSQEVAGEVEEEQRWEAWECSLKV